MNKEIERKLEIIRKLKSNSKNDKYLILSEMKEIRKQISEADDKGKKYIMYHEIPYVENIEQLLSEGYDFSIDTTRFFPDTIIKWENKNNVRYGNLKTF